MLLNMAPLAHLSLPAQNSPHQPTMAHNSPWPTSPPVLNPTKSLRQVAVLAQQHNPRLSSDKARTVDESG